MQPRVTTGSAKNRKLKVPFGARPLTDVMKRSIFDSLAELTLKATVVDLFAGSGSFGIEALSRGAASCDFVDEDSESCQVIKDNLLNTGLGELGRVIYRDTEGFIQARPGQYDLVFADPPFDEIEDFSVNRILKLMHAESIFILKSPAKYTGVDQLKSFKLVAEKYFGDTRISYWIKNQPE